MIFVQKETIWMCLVITTETTEGQLINQQIIYNHAKFRPFFMNFQHNFWHCMKFFE